MESSFSTPDLSLKIDLTRDAAKINLSLFNYFVKTNSDGSISTCPGYAQTKNKILAGGNDRSISSVPSAANEANDNNFRRKFSHVNSSECSVLQRLSLPTEMSNGRMNFITPRAKVKIIISRNEIVSINPHHSG